MLFFIGIALCITPAWPLGIMLAVYSISKGVDKDRFGKK